MGNWQLEVARMCLYMAFPVGLFHFFNQPEYFESHVRNIKEEWYPPNIHSNSVNLRKEIDEFLKEKEFEKLKALKDEDKRINTN